MMLTAKSSADGMDDGAEYYPSGVGAGNNQGHLVCRVYAGGVVPDSTLGGLQMPLVGHPIKSRKKNHTPCLQ